MSDVSESTYLINPLGADDGGTVLLDPMDIPGVDSGDPRGVIPRSRLQGPLQVNIPMWNPRPEPLLDEPHIVRLRWVWAGVDEVVDSRQVFGPPPPLPAVISLEVPLSRLTDEGSGTAQLYYTVQDSFGGVSVLNPRRTLTIDLDSPELLNPLDTVDFVVAPTPNVDEQYLLDNVPVAFNIPFYTVRADRDRIEFYLSNRDNPPLSAADAEYVIALASDPLVAYVDPDIFRRLNNGDAYIFYRIFDEAGNFSSQSAGLLFQLALTPLPSNLPRPQIRPPAYDDGLIKRDDARRGVFMRIDPAYDDWAPGDQVIAYWNARPTVPQPVLSFPCDVEIPWLTLRGPAPVLIPEAAVVRYEIIRGALPPFRSLSERFNVDLTIAGQDHPNAPALLNPTLASVTVIGRGSKTPNQLNHLDRGLAAQAYVPLFADPVAGQLLSLFWNGVGPVASHPVQLGEVGGQLVWFTDIPWNLIEGTVNPRLPVHYLTSNGVNEQQSPPTFVNVDVTALIDFTPPQVQHTLTSEYVTCCSSPSPLYGVHWLIPGNIGLQLNDEVRFHWQGYARNNWVDPIAGTEYEETIQVLQPHIDNGIKVVVEPFDRTLEPMREYGSAVASFEVWRNLGKVGDSRPDVKGSGHIRVDLTFPTGGFCKPGDVISCTSDGKATLVKD
jgi:hypothetical protein